jgi:DNA modification methylase
MVMQIVELNIEQLLPADYNPRKELKAGMPEYEKLKKSIEEFGLVEPIIFNECTLNIVGGHQRVAVLRDLGWTTVPVSIVRLSQSEEQLLNLALNKIDGKWDDEKLKELLEQLNEEGQDITLSGFDLSEINSFIPDFDGETSLLPEDDDFNVDETLQEIDEPTTKLGDVWILGNHRLMCGDSTKKEDVDTLMNGAKAEMCFTDPPWNVAYGSNLKEGNAQGYKPRTIMNDKMSTNDFKEFMDSAFKNMKQSLVSGGMVYVVMSCVEWGNVMLSLFEQGFHWSSTIIWNKDHLVLSRKDYHTKFEPIYYGWSNDAPRVCPLKDRKQSDVWDFDRPTRSEEHPTMKPIPLVSRAIINSSKKNNLVIDLFGGSGTTLLACEMTDRINYSMELDPKYCDVIIKRWENYTQQKAILENENEPHASGM